MLRHFHEMAPFLHCRHLYPPNRFPRKSEINVVNQTTMYLLWFNFILGLNYFPLVLTRYHPLTFLKTKFKPGKKLNRNIYSSISFP